MGRLFEMRKKIDTALKGKKDEFMLRGQIGMMAGILVGGITEQTPDDPAKIEKLEKAARQVLGISV